MRLKTGASLVAAGIVGLVAVSLFPANAQAATASAPVVVVTAASGTVNTLQFQFPSDVSSDDANAVIAAVERALGTHAHAGSPSTKDGIRRYTVDVNVAQRDGFSHSRITAATWAAIARAANEPVAIELRDGFQIASGDVHRVSGGVGTRRRFAVVPSSDVVYGMSTTPIWTYLLFLIALVALSLFVVRPYARRVEHGPGEAADRAHRLQRLSLFGGISVIAIFALMIITGWGPWIPAVVSAGVFPRTAGWRWMPPTMLAVGIVVPILVWCVSLGSAVQPSYRRLRGIQRKQSRRARVGFLAMGLGPLTLYIAALTIGGRFGSTGRLVAVLVYLAFVLLAWPALVIHILPTRPTPRGLEEHFEALCRSQKTSVRGIRVLKAKRNKMANAALMGVGPFRYVLVTDYLIDNLDADAIDAVVLHEIGHAKQHHLLKKLAAVIVELFVVAAVVGAAAAGLHFSPKLVLAAVVIALPMSMLLTNGIVGVRLETRADDFAASVVGPDALRRGLLRLTELNMMKRHTGPVWNLLTQHPGVDQRLARLDAMSTEPETRELAAADR